MNTSRAHFGNSLWRGHSCCWAAADTLAMTSTVMLCSICCSSASFTGLFTNGFEAVCVCLSIPAGIVCLSGGQLESKEWCMTFRKGQQEDLLFRLQRWGLASLSVHDKHVTGNIYVTSKKGFFCNSRFSTSIHD